jgi:hypothetical protein
LLMSPPFFRVKPGYSYSAYYLCYQIISISGRFSMWSGLEI